MAGHHPDWNAPLAHECGKPEPDRLQTEKVDLFGIEPPRIVFAKPCRFHEGPAFELRSIGDEVLTWAWKHEGLIGDFSRLTNNERRCQVPSRYFGRAVRDVIPNASQLQRKNETCTGRATSLGATPMSHPGSVS